MWTRDSWLLGGLCRSIFCMLIYFLIPSTPSPISSPGHFQIWQAYVPPLSQCLEKRFTLQAMLRVWDIALSVFQVLFLMNLNLQGLACRTWNFAFSPCTSAPFPPEKAGFCHNHHYSPFITLLKKAKIFLHFWWFTIVEFLSVVSFSILFFPRLSSSSLLPFSSLVWPLLASAF